MSQNHPPQPNQPGQAPQYGQPGDAGSRYGTTPYQQAGPYGDPVERPAKLDLLLKLTLGSLALWLLSSLVGLLFPPSDDAMREQIRRQLEGMGQPVDEAAIDSAMALGQATALVTTLVMLVLGVGLYLLVYLPLRKGKNWARILGIVLAILGLVLTAWGFSGLGVYEGPARIISIVIGVLFMVVNVFWLITAFNKDVAAYTRAQSERPRY